jgi:hypothetical protein
MSSDFEQQEPSFRLEPVERRGEIRGLFLDLFVTLDNVGRCRAPEASRKGFFVELDEPDGLPLGASLSVAVDRGPIRFDCRVEVVRKEIDPRRGVALRIAHISPVAEEQLKRALGR